MPSTTELQSQNATQFNQREFYSRTTISHSTTKPFLMQQQTNHGQTHPGVCSLFSWTSHRTDCSHHIKFNRIRKGLYSPKYVLSEGKRFRLLLSFLFQCTTTSYKSTRTRSNSSKRVRYSLVQLDKIISLCRCAFCQLF